MKEEEAKEKWCPMTRESCDGSYNRVDGEMAEYACCLGSQCMMWRETRTGEGHCGLAGKE